MSFFRKTAASAGIGAGNLAAWWARKAAGSANVLEVNLAGQVVEEVHLSGIWQRLLPSPFLSMRELLAAIDYAAEDQDIKVLLLRISDHDLGWGRAEELAEGIRNFRAAGKYALAHLEDPENLDTLIAASCDRVTMPSGASYHLTGLLSEVMYLKGLLDMLEIKPELFQAGKYKSAVEPYTRSAMSREHREAMEAVLDNIYDRWVQALARSRGLGEDRVRELIDRGPWRAEEALEHKLVDALIYEDEIDDYLEKWLGLMPVRIAADRFLRLYGTRPGLSEPWKNQPALALITATGPIHGGESRYYGPGDATVGADTLRAALQQVREDDGIAAVVLRVDSPGGSATHSDLIWREVERLRAAKPVVVSMADVAASGGYYIAMPADYIVASPGTLTGSIGVIGGKMNLKGLYTKLGIKKEQVHRGRHADIVTDYGAYSAELKSKMRQEMDAVYRLFVDKAASSRKRDRAEIEAAAQGRVWTGDQAKSLGLVDELGNLLAAVRRAKERAGIAVSKRVPLVILPRMKKLSLPAMPFSLPLPSGANRLLLKLMAYENLADRSALTLLPFSIKIK